MNSFLLVLAVVAFQSGTHSAFIPTYQLDEDIQSNIIEHKQDVIEGLVPPKPRAQDHFKNQLKEPSSYLVEVSSKYLKLTTAGLPSEAIELTEKEAESVQKLAVAFVKLLYSSIISSEETLEDVPLPDWKETYPLFNLNNSGITLQFLNSSDDEIPTVATTESERKIVWDFLAKYAKNVLEAKLKELNVTEKDVTSFETPKETGDEFRKFIDNLWRIMKVSIDYAETALSAWTAPPETTTVEKEETPRSLLTTSTIFAYEEPLPRHVFPSEEFEFRRKDVDSIYYGRGII